MINKAMLTKDNEITKVLSIISKSDKFTLVLKGGTSLTKGYQIAERMSEDIDLLFFAKNGAPVSGESVSKFTEQVRKDLKEVYTLENEKPKGASSRNHFSCSIKNIDNTEIKLDLRYSKIEILFEQKEIYDFKEDGGQVKANIRFNVAGLTRTFFDKIFAFQNKTYTTLAKSNRYNKLSEEEKNLGGLLSKPEIKRLARHAYDITKIYPLIKFSKEDIAKHLEGERKSYFVSKQERDWLQKFYNDKSIHNFFIFTKVDKIDGWFTAIKNDFINGVNVAEVKKQIKKIRKDLKTIIS